MTYTIETTDSFEKQFKKKHRDKVDHLESVISKLEKHPDKYGKPLRGKLHGTWQIKIGGNFRIWYEINEENKRVILKAIYHKDKAKKKY